MTTSREASAYTQVTPRSSFGSTNSGAAPYKQAYRMLLGHVSSAVGAVFLSRLQLAEKWSPGPPLCPATPSLHRLCTGTLQQYVAARSEIVAQRMPLPHHRPCSGLEMRPWQAQTNGYFDAPKADQPASSQIVTEMKRQARCARERHIPFPSLDAVAHLEHPLCGGYRMPQPRGRGVELDPICHRLRAQG